MGQPVCAKPWSLRAFVAKWKDRHEDRKLNHFPRPALEEHMLLKIVIIFIYHYLVTGLLCILQTDTCCNHDH